MSKELKTEESWQPFYVGDEWRKVFLIPASAFKVWWYHYSRENKRRESWPSIGLIAAECDLERKTVFAARKWLVDNGWLVEVRRLENSNIPVYRVEKGIAPYGEETPEIGTDDEAVPKNGTTAVPFFGTPPVPENGTTPIPKNGTQTNTNKPVPIESIPKEPIPTVQKQLQDPHPEKRDTPPSSRVQTREEIQAELAGCPDAKPLVDKFIELGHFIWKKKNQVAGNREQCTKAFEKLLEDHPPALIMSVIEYTAQSVEFGNGVRTVNNVYPWDWFVDRFDQISTTMEADEEREKKKKRRMEKLKDQAAAKPSTNPVTAARQNLSYNQPEHGGFAAEAETQLFTPKKK
jgi:hypothetical protein